MLTHNQTHKLNCFFSSQKQTRYRCLSPVLPSPSRSSPPPSLCHCLNSWCRSDLTSCPSSLDGAKQRGWRRPPRKLWVTRRVCPHFLWKLRRWRGFLLLLIRVRGGAREDGEEKICSLPESLGARVLLFSGSSWQQSVTQKWADAHSVLQYPAWQGQWLCLLLSGGKVLLTLCTEVKAEILV